MEKEFCEVDFNHLKNILIKDCSEIQFSNSQENELKTKIALSLNQKKTTFFEKVLSDNKVLDLYENLTNNYPHIKNTPAYLNNELLQLLYEIIFKSFKQIAWYIPEKSLTANILHEEKTHFINYSIDYILNTTTIKAYTLNGAFHFQNLNNGLEKIIFTQFLFFLRAKNNTIQHIDLVLFRIELMKKIETDIAFNYLRPFVAEIIKLEEDFHLLSEDSISHLIKPKYDKEKMKEFICSYLYKPSQVDIIYLLESKSGKITKPFHPKTFNHLAHILYLLEKNNIITEQVRKNLVSENKILKASGNRAIISNIQTVFSKLKMDYELLDQINGNITRLNAGNSLLNKEKHKQIDKLFNSILSL